MSRFFLFSLVTASLCSAFAVCQASSTAVIAVASGSTLSLYDDSGNIVRRFDLQHPVAGFSLSPDRRMVAIVSPDTEHGGALVLIDLKTGTRRQLTHGHGGFKQLDKGETEVYDSPAFSPDGRSLAFAVHGNRLGDGNDAWENSGPIAVLELASGKLTVLNATNNIDGNGPCSESDPQWSPDGKWILFNCEDGAFITDALGKSLRDLKLGTDPEASTSAVSWVGNGCVLYVQSHTGATSPENEPDEIRLLNLRKSKSQISTVLPALPKQSLTGLRESSDDAAIMESSSGVTIETRGKVWVFPEIEQEFDGYVSHEAPAAHVIGGWRTTSIPHECE